jgi:hypothetical protein
MQETPENGTNGQRQMLNGERDYESAIDRVIDAAQNTLHIFDSDLASGGYSSLKRYDALNAFLRKSDKNRLIIILHETEHVSAYCPRIMNLLKTHSHVIAIHKTMEHARIANDPFVVADDLHYVHRFHRDGARSLLALNDPAGARQIEERFQQLLEASHPAVFATTLGL